MLLWKPYIFNLKKKKHSRKTELVAELQQINERKWDLQNRKAKRKPSLTPNQKKTRLLGAEAKQVGSVDDWMKVIFSDESLICFGHWEDD